MANKTLTVPPSARHSVIGTTSDSGAQANIHKMNQQGALPLESHLHPLSLVNPEHTSASLQVPSSPSATSIGGDTLLRSRSNSTNSMGESTRSRTISDVRTLRPGSRFEGDDLTAEEALQPDKGNEQDFRVIDSPFAFSPGQLNKMQNPKSLAAFKALGGIRGLEKGLKTNLDAGLSVDETVIAQRIGFDEATHFKDVARHVEAVPTIMRDIPVEDYEIKGQYHDRMRIFRDNRLPSKKSLSIWKLFWNAFNDRILIILTAAAVISLALGVYEAVGQRRSANEPQSLDWVEGLAIQVAVVIVVLVTGVNDYRREKQFETLNAKKDDRQVKAIRSGKSTLISVFDVMVGDVLHLESGDAVPADGILISGHGIRCDESSATGESDSMKKTAGQEVWDRITNETATSELDPFVISGSKVLEGVGTYLVTSVGINSSHGKIMVSLQTENEDTPLQVKLAHLANWIGYIGTSVAALLFFILFIRFLAGLSGNAASGAKKGSQFLDILIVAITIIVVAVPEGLPVAVTLALSFATKKMLRENNLVRHLRACETMGNATTICSDKTGTLTQNKMTVVAGLLGSNVCFAREIKADDDRSFSIKDAFERTSAAVKSLFLQSAALNSTAFDGEEAGKTTFIGSKTETAILVLAKEQLGMGPVAEERAGIQIIQLFPFDSDRKCMGVVVKLPSGAFRLLIKGAAEILLTQATRVLSDISDGSLENENLSDMLRARISSNIYDFASQSLRTIAFLYRDFHQWPPIGVRTLEEDGSMALFEDVFQEMTFLGLVGIQDPLRDGVSKAVHRCQTAGIKVRMVTGDNITTATAIAEQCGIKTEDGYVMDGPSFRKLSDEDMDQALPKLQVLARSSPEDKRILVTRLKRLGETVAVTGDGTNDGPALKSADVGFSMGIAGTEVAKEASAIILLDDNFSSIVFAIMWGRSVNDSVAKFLQFQLTVNITAVVLAFVSAVSSPDSHSVLSAVQLLWVNLIMDTFAALALATDAPREKILDRKPSPKRAPLITTNMWKMIIGQAVYQLVITFVLYFRGFSLLGYQGQLADLPDSLRASRSETLHKELNTMVFNTFVWMQIFNEFNNRRLDNKLNIFEGVHRNWFFIGINCIMVGGQIMIIFVGGMAFGIKRIDGLQWGICIALAAPCLLWAILLRLIPDEYAGAAFGWAARAWRLMTRPIAASLVFVFSPVVKAICAFAQAVFVPIGRLVARVFNKVLHRKGRTDAGVEAGFGDAEKTTTALASAELTRPLPPITLTAAS